VLQHQPGGRTNKRAGAYVGAAPVQGSANITSLYTARYVPGFSTVAHARRRHSSNFQSPLLPVWRVTTRWEMSVDMQPPRLKNRDMPGEPEEQFSFTRAALNTCGRAKVKVLLVEI